MSTSTVQQLVAFTLGAEEYALPIDEVQEIIRYTPPRSVAATDDAVRGVIALRGKIVPVHDLDRQLGLPSRDADPTKIIMVEAADGQVGIVVDDVTEVLTVDTAQIEPAPMAAAAVAGIAQVGERLVVVLDTGALFGGRSAVVSHDVSGSDPVAPDAAVLATNGAAVGASA
ncbi:MAG: chemotaxis protein CheW [Solirubrobacteraceae bacterium]